MEQTPITPQDPDIPEEAPHEPMDPDPELHDEPLGVPADGDATEQELPGFPTTEPPAAD